MKVKLLGKNLQDIKPLLKANGIKIDAKHPELIITHGGDGALLGAEHQYPGIPKFPLRDLKTAPLCKHHNYEEQIRQLKNNTLAESSLIKLEARSKGGKLAAINDIFIHNVNRVSALRYRVYINDELYAHEIVGDGVGVATPHGSTAYYRSITHSMFRTGIGLAFSNSTELVNHLVLPENARIRVKILRGPAVLVADNNPEQIALRENDIVEIYKGADTAVVYGLDNFMCQKCRLLRHPKKVVL